MKFSIKQTHLAQAIGITSRVITGKNTLPVLDNVLIEAKDNMLTFTGTSLETSTTHTIEAEIITPGAITIPMRLLQGYVSLIDPKEEITCDVKEDSTANLSVKNAKSAIKGIEAEQFPTIPTIKKEKEIYIETKDFVEAVNLVAFATSGDQIRPILTGVLCKSEHGVMTFAGTDSYRLAEKKIKTGDKSDDMEVIIPARCLNDAAKTLGETDAKGTVSIIISRHQVIFKGEKTTFIARTIEGRFPPYEQIIPKEAKNEIKFEKEDAIRDIRRASLFNNDGSIKLSFEKDGVKIESMSQEGSEETTIEGVVTKHKSGSITINASFLLEALSHIKSSEVVLRVNDLNMPALIQGVGQEDYAYVIMPLNPQG